VCRTAAFLFDQPAATRASRDAVQSRSGMVLSGNGIDVRNGSSARIARNPQHDLRADEYQKNTELSMC
jgi:hypothetical protein